MAKTFIGELILKFKDDASGGAKKTAQNLQGSVNQIEAAARKFSQTSWGGKFEQQLAKLGASSKEIDHLRVSWDNLHASMTSRNLSSALRRSDIGNWKTATTGHFAQIRAEVASTEQKVMSLRQKLGEVGRFGLIAAGTGTAMYAGGQGVRSGVQASAEWEREKFRQSMGNIPDAEKDQLVGRSEQLGLKYPSISVTDIAELSRNARSMMGSTSEGLAVLEEMVKGMVTLQSAQGVDVGAGTLRNMLRGIDNLGQNSGGPQGIANTKEIMAGMIRAAQIEGADFDPGKLFEFARRAKVAGPGFSTEFIATLYPAIAQDMTANGAGTSFGTQFQSFVMGSNATNNKQNMQAQRDLGIRGGPDDKLVQSKLFGQDPFKWVQSVLRPALIKSGVDVKDDNAVTEAIGDLTKAQMASYGMIRMITQADQINRNRASYAKAMGPDAADPARYNDPFVAFEGFTTSFRNLAAAMGEDTMPTILAGMNSMTDGVNRLQQAWRDGDPLTKAGIAGGSGLAGLGTWKVVAGIYSLTTAGPALNVAAASLEAAAISLGAAGVAGDVTGGGKGKGAGAVGAGAIASRLPGFATLMSLLSLSGSSADNTYVDASPEERQRLRDEAATTTHRMNTEANKMADQDSVPAQPSPHQSDLSAAEADSRKFNMVQGYEDRISGRGPADPVAPSPPASAPIAIAGPIAAPTATDFFGPALPKVEIPVQDAAPGIDPSAMQSAVDQATTTGDQIKTALSPMAAPTVDLTALQSAVSLAREFLGLMTQVGGVAKSTPNKAAEDIGRAMNRNFTDQGVVP